MSLSNYINTAVFLIILCFFSFNVMSYDEVSSISRGGMLYDRWYKVIDAPKPKITHPAWPSSNDKTGPSTHRCKSCHGWDYKGKDGAYSSGKYYTGIPGVLSYLGKDINDVIDIITNDVHGFGNKMSDKDIEDVALFIIKGQFDFSNFVDEKTKLAKVGNLIRGEEYYNTVCAKCHGKDGKLIEDMTPVGDIARKNPWEVLHKIINGQPGAKMPSLRAFDFDVVTDIFSYIQTLEK